MANNNNPAETYRLAYKEALEETKRVQALIDRLDAITAALRGKGWKSVGLSTGASQSIGFRGTPRGSAAITLSDLPKADEIHQGIVDWHRKRDRLEHLIPGVAADDLPTLPDASALDK
jgi:hypothetical protein